MWSFLKKIGSAIAKIFGAGGPAEAAVKRALAIVPVALPIVEMIAKATPTRADDEIIALFREHGLPWVEYWLGPPVEKRGAALFQAASLLLVRLVPGMPMNIINAAVQIAYTAWKAEQK